MSKTNFDPEDISGSPPGIQIPGELWTSIISTSCAFESRYFLDVMENLIKNPNVTSSCLFRADIFYDSLNDATILVNVDDEHFSKFTQHMKAEYRPIKSAAPEGYQHQRTLVRRMVPRNPQLDKALVQTCHIYNAIPIKEYGNEAPEGEEEKLLILLIPHATAPEEIPYYHPTVKSLAMQHTWNTLDKTGTLSIHYNFFPSTPLDTRLQRTALNLLKTIHKHGTGQAAGYTKRVHHDLIVPQAKFQDTYTRLKTKYAKSLIGAWAEQTDPEKHVFEDLGIAAFLIELWESMYGKKGDEQPGNEKPEFPGFVDIGCGNGVLVHVLQQEGYAGWGFDARKRMTWRKLPEEVQLNLKEMLLVPEILRKATDNHPGDDSEETPFHNGTFPQGTFIISNHADELTPWTPLLAYLSESPFLAIPCCSHNLTGARCRFNGGTARKTEATGPGPRTGSLAKNGKNGKQVSAYQGLTTYVANMAVELGFRVEKEMLRIPSTRNAAILGRVKAQEEGGEGPGKFGIEYGREGREAEVLRLLEREVGNVDNASRDWVERARKIALSKGNCH